MNVRVGAVSSRSNLKGILSCEIDRPGRRDLLYVESLCRRR